ncbi:hypothetical protein FS749_003888 [Ceratobasidium sp. UAMH 11750]|nr:hypothetical protein FS749_003888 [Ceratobasidium sp. UAMH 11750]
MCVRSGDREQFELHLHNLDKSIVQGDIRKYLQVGLKRANISSEDLETLTERSGALFIYAATVVRYIGAHNFLRSDDRLEQVLAASTSSSDSEKEINALYATILADAFDDPSTSDQEKGEMRLVLHTAICAQEPLNARIMAGILGLKRDGLVHAALNPLRSVLDIQKANEGITTLHKSFPDYMFDQARSGRFHCDAEQHHATLVERCFAVIRIPSPPVNICHLESSYLLDKDVADLHERVEQHISGVLFYACRYWSSHLDLAGGSRGPLHKLHRFLSERLLLWMEVMNLKRCLQPNGVDMLAQVKKLVEHRGYAAETRELAADAYDFVHAYSASPASNSTPHIYVSALSFWEKERSISKHYSTVVRSAIQPMRQALPTSGSSTLPIYTLGSSVRSVAFSPDGERIAAGSDDATVRVWDVLTRQLVGIPLEGHTGPVCSVTYSPDFADIFASSSTDGTIRTWNINTGPDALLEGHAGAVCSVLYSPNGDYLISGFADGTIRSWYAFSAKIRESSRGGHTGAARSVAWLPDNTRVVSGSGDGTIRTWASLAESNLFDVTASLFQDQNGAVYSVACSPDGARIISGSEDKTIRIWDAKTGQAIGNPLEGHTAAVYSVAYSPSGSRIISGSADHTIRIWDAALGETVVGPLVGHHGPVHSVACSPNGDIIASGSADNTICIWDATTGRMMQEPLKWRTRTSHSIAYLTETTSSPSFADYDVRCSWDAGTGHLRLNPSLQNALSHPIVTNPRVSGKPNTCYVQDQFVIPHSCVSPEQNDYGGPLDFRHGAVGHPTGPGSSTSTAGGSTCSSWAFDPDGWVLTDDPSQHLFWVPQEVRDRIWHPQTTGSIIGQNVIWFDSSVVGEGWHRCYIELAEREQDNPKAGGRQEQEAPGDPEYPHGNLGMGEEGNADTKGEPYSQDQGATFLVISAMMLVLSIICAYILL